MKLLKKCYINKERTNSDLLVFLTLKRIKTSFFLKIMYNRKRKGECIMNEQEIKIILHALQEDGYNSDITSTSIVEKGKQVNANLVASTSGIISGVDVAQQVFKLTNNRLQVTIHRPNGSFVNRGTVIMSVYGPLRDILRAEQVAINFIERLSGIATITNQFVLELAGTSTQVLDTRNTTPGLRAFEKRAVIHGGGTNHNMTLGDCISIRRPHIIASGSVTNAFNLVNSKNKDKLITEIEVETKEEFLEAIATACDLIILCNMSEDEIKEIVSINDNKKSLGVKMKITTKKARAIAKLGVDYLIIDDLMHSYKVVDIDVKFYKELG